MAVTLSIRKQMKNLLDLGKTFPHTSSLASSWTIGALGRCPRSASRAALHLDTNKRPHRHVTVLVYLNDVTEGGETVFPLANAHESLKSAAHELAVAGLHHTQDKPENERHENIMKILNQAGEDAAEGKAGAKVHPSRGTACVFYSMLPTGEVDSSSYHFGVCLPVQPPVRPPRNHCVTTVGRRLDHGTVRGEVDAAVLQGAARGLALHEGTHALRQEDAPARHHGGRRPGLSKVK